MRSRARSGSSELLEWLQRVEAPMHLLVCTILLRPYVFIFLAAFLFASVVNFGLRTTLAYLAFSYGVALGCEWSSIHNGFPFGLYHYFQTTRGREIWVAGVPFFDSLSFTFLGFASYTVALLLLSPIKREGADVRLLDTWPIRRSNGVWILAALLMVMVDLVADPLSVLGQRWFLGKLFWYDPPGPHFGVPISNYAGWFLVALLGIRGFQWFDSAFNRGKTRPAGVWINFPSRALLGPGLYAGIVIFSITMLFLINARAIAWSSIFIYLPFTVLAIHLVRRANSSGGRDSIAAHLADFAYDRRDAKSESRKASAHAALR
jgi:uncharacterized membrane protein